MGRKGNERGTLSLRAQYIPVASKPKSYELANSYFNVSKGNRVRMYQDAHCPAPQAVPYFSQIQLPPGLVSHSDSNLGGPCYHPASCWKDIYEAIQVQI